MMRLFTSTGYRRLNSFDWAVRLLNDDTIPHTRRLNRIIEIWEPTFTNVTYTQMGENGNCTEIITHQMLFLSFSPCAFVDVWQIKPTKEKKIGTKVSYLLLVRGVMYRSFGAPTGCVHVFNVDISDNFSFSFHLFINPFDGCVLSSESRMCMYLVYNFVLIGWHLYRQRCSFPKQSMWCWDKRGSIFWLTSMYPTKWECVSHSYPDSVWMCWIAARCELVRSMRLYIT